MGPWLVTGRVLTDPVPFFRPVLEKHLAGDNSPTNSHPHRNLASLVPTLARPLRLSFVFVLRQTNYRATVCTRRVGLGLRWRYRGVHRRLLPKS
jgi:hypothetical protein